MANKNPLAEAKKQAGYATRFLGTVRQQLDKGERGSADYYRNRVWDAAVAAGQAATAAGPKAKKVQELATAATNAAMEADALMAPKPTPPAPARRHQVDPATYISPLYMRVADAAFLIVYRAHLAAGQYDRLHAPGRDHGLRLMTAADAVVRDNVADFAGPDMAPGIAKHAHALAAARLALYNIPLGPEDLVPDPNPMPVPPRQLRAAYASA